MRWDEFTVACPELADLAHDRFTRDELALLGTIRRDGRPRISPCEVDFAVGRLLLGMMWQSPKAKDLLRDARLAVHSVPSDRMNPGGWQPEEPYHLFSLDVTEGAFMRFTEDEKQTWRWAPVGGLHKESGPNA